MILSRTPFRISFFGGGTDYPAWYKENGGAVLSAAINKYSYITCRYLPPFFDYKYRIRYYQREEANRIEDIKHPAVRECLSFSKNRSFGLIFRPLKANYLNSIVHNVPRELTWTSLLLKYVNSILFTVL